MGLCIGVGFLGKVHLGYNIMITGRLLGDAAEPGGAAGKVPRPEGGICLKQKLRIQIW